MDFFSILIATLALVFGGVLKGATGAGAPLIAIPAIAALFDVPTAICIFCLPNFLINIWQSWHFRQNQKSIRLVWSFAFAGAIGVTFGTYFLTYVSSLILNKVLAFVIFFFLIFKIVNSEWLLPRVFSIAIAPIIGCLGGLLQGMTGLSGPVILIFLNAMRLERTEFIATIAVFFMVTAIPQIILLVTFEVLNFELAVLSFFAIFPIIFGMLFGQHLGNKWSQDKFDRVVSVLLCLIMIKLFVL